MKGNNGESVAEVELEQAALLKQRGSKIRNNV